jgi:hypothetical protein
MNDNDTPCPYAANTERHEAFMNAARLLERKNTIDEANRPQPEPRREGRRGLL